MAVRLSSEIIKAAISPSPFYSPLPRPPVPPMLPPGGAAAVSGWRAGARGGQDAHPPRPTPPHPAPPAPAAARQRRPLGPRTLARTRSSRSRHVPGGGGGDSPARGARSGDRGRPVESSAPTRRGAPSPLAAASCAEVPRDTRRGGGGRGGPAPGPLTACHRRLAEPRTEFDWAARNEIGWVGRARPLPCFGEGGREQRRNEGLLQGAGDWARNRASPSSSPVATPPSPSQTWSTADAGDFSSWSSASVLSSLSLSSSPLQPSLTLPKPSLKTSPVSVRLSPQPPRSQGSADWRLAVEQARDFSGTGRAAWLPRPPPLARPFRQPFPAAPPLFQLYGGASRAAGRRIRMYQVGGGGGSAGRNSSLHALLLPTRLPPLPLRRHPLEKGGGLKGWARKHRRRHWHCWASGIRSSFLWRPWQWMGLETYGNGGGDENKLCIAHPRYFCRGEYTSLWARTGKTMLPSRFEAEGNSTGILAALQEVSSPCPERRGAGERPSLRRSAPALQLWGPPLPRRILGARRGCCVRALTCARWDGNAGSRKNISVYLQQRLYRFIICPLPFIHSNDLFWENLSAFFHIWDGISEVISQVLDKTALRKYTVSQQRALWLPSEHFIYTLWLIWSNLYMLLFNHEGVT